MLCLRLNCILDTIYYRFSVWHISFYLHPYRLVRCYYHRPNNRVHLCARGKPNYAMCELSRGESNWLNKLKWPVAIIGYRVAWCDLHYRVEIDRFGCICAFHPTVEFGLSFRLDTAHWHAMILAFVIFGFFSASPLYIVMAPVNKAPRHTPVTAIANWLI